VIVKDKVLLKYLSINSHATVDQVQHNFNHNLACAFSLLICWLRQTLYLN